MNAGSTVQAAAFRLPAGGGGARFVRDGSEERLRCASVLKPLVFWAAAGLAPYADAPGDWERLAREAVTVSANDPTVEAWEACGTAALLGTLAGRTGMSVPLERGGARSFGRVLVTADDVVLGYAALAAADDAPAARLRGWMREVPDHQTFGVRPMVAGPLGAAPADVGVKCGWFCDADEDRVRTHAVTLTTTPGGVVGTAVLTAAPVDAAFREAYAAAYRGGEEVLDLHERVAGPAVRAATARAVRSILRPA